MVPSKPLQPTPVAVLGVPFDRQSSYLRGPALAPARIRECLACDSANMWTENGIDLAATESWKDVGDVAFADENSEFKEDRRHRRRTAGERSSASSPWAATILSPTPS